MTLSINNETKRLIFITIILIIVNSILFFYILGKNPNDLKAKNGILDLTKWDFNQDGAVRLGGDWEFFWKNFIDSKSDVEPDLFVKVPDVWNNYKIGEESLPPFGFATYRIKVKGVAREPLSIKIQPCSTAYELYIDDNLIARNGTLSRDKDGFVPQYKPESKTFIPASNNFTITVHIANFVYARGGMWNIAMLGKPSQIENINRAIIYRDLFLLGSFITMMIFCFCIYGLGEQKPFIIIFALLTLSVAVRITLYGERIILSYVSAFGVVIVIEYLTLIWIPVLISLFMQCMTQNKRNRKFTPAVLLSATLLTIIVLLTPISFFTRFTMILEVFGAVITIYSLICILLSKKKSKYLIATGILSFLISGVYDILFHSCIISGYAEYTPIGFYIMFNIWAVVLALEYTTKVQTTKESIKKAHDAEIALLQAQIKPHFLYNSLNVISTLCKLNGEYAEKLTIELAKYLHYTFDFVQSVKFISFSEELEFVKTYVKIEKARFVNEFDVVYDLCDTSEIMVPPLSIQPLIENAIRHGVRKSGKFGNVFLKVREEDADFTIEIIDQGAGIEPLMLEKIRKGIRPENCGVGITNVKQRIEQIYKTNFEIVSELDSGTHITITIPKEVREI